MPIELLVASVNDPSITLAAIASLGLALYLVVLVWRDRRPRKDSHHARRRQRRQYWGYE